MEKQHYGNQILVLVLLGLGLQLLSGIFQFVLGDSTNALRISLVLSQLMGFALPVVLMAKMYGHNMKDLLQLDFGHDKWLKAGAAMVVLVLLLPGIELLSGWNDGWHLGGRFAALEEVFRSLTSMSEAMMNRLLEAKGIGYLFFNLVVVALAPAVCEELFFRCGLQQLLVRGIKNHHVAIVLTAVVFSAAHGDLFGLMPRIVLGLLLGYLFYYSGSLLTNMAVHFLNNGLVVVLYYLNNIGAVCLSPEEPFSFGFSITLMCSIAAIGVFATTFAKVEKSEKELEK